MFNRTEQRDYLTACRVIAAFFEDRELDMLRYYKGSINSAISRAHHNAYQDVREFYREFYGTAWDMDAWIFGTAWDDEIQRLFTYSELEIPRDRGAL